MKKDWTYKKLGEVAEIVGGSTPKTDIEEYWGGNHYWVTPAELDGSKYIESTQRTITDKAIEKTNLSLLPSGTVLLSSRAPIGKVCITKSPMYCNQGFKNIVCGDSLYNEFVYYYLCNSVDYLQSLGTGATFKEISKKVVEKVEIPVPSIEEQHQIVAELDLLSGMIEKQKSQIEELDKLSQSIFYDMFGDPVANEKCWEERCIGDVCKIKSGNSNANNSTPGTLPYVKVGDMNLKGNETYITLSSSYVDKDENIKDVFPIGTTIFPKRGGAILTNKKRLTMVEICCDLNVMGVIPNQHIIHPMYIFFYFLKMDFKIFGETGSAIPQINNHNIAPLKIGVPPLSLQQEFAAKIEAIEAMKAKVRQSLKESETLFNSRMDYYFN